MMSNVICNLINLLWYFDWVDSDFLVRGVWEFIDILGNIFWKSDNSGVHDRVDLIDTSWGDLIGGSDIIGSNCSWK